MPYFDGKMPYLVLPRRKSKCLRENRKLAKPKFMFYQSLTRIWHNLQVHVESQIKNFFILQKHQKSLLSDFCYQTGSYQKYSNYSIFKWCAPPYIWWVILMTHPSSTKVEVFGFVTNGHFRDNKDTNLEFRFRLRTFG